MAITTEPTARSSELPTVADQGEFTAGLCLAHAGPMKVSIRYELVGNPAYPLLLVAGGISAGRHSLANDFNPTDGWWQSQASTFKQSRVLSIDWVASAGELDLPIDASDQARALLATLDELGINAAAAFIGASYGAMVGMHCAATAPDRVGALLAISGAGRAHPYSAAQRALQRQAIELGERLGSPEAGVSLARKMAILTYRTPREFADRFDTGVTLASDRVQASAEPYLDHVGERHSARMSAIAYRRLSESIDLHRIDPTRITIPSTFVAVPSDQIVPAADIEALARSVPHSRFVSLPSVFGHDAFLKEEEAVAAIITNFLNSLEQQP